eukprot:3757821-Amphidinium_carterae.1
MVLQWIHSFAEYDCHARRSWEASLYWRCYTGLSCSADEQVPNVQVELARTLMAIASQEAFPRQHVHMRPSFVVVSDNKQKHVEIDFSFPYNVAKSPCWNGLEG